MHFGHFIILATSLLYHLAAANETRPWLMPTEYIDSDHPTIVARAESITKDADDQRSKAIYIHDYVRDEVRFGWSSDFYDQKASEVLEEGVGFCNTKSTLMVALLRAAGIPARQRFVDIRSEIIIDFIDPRTDYVDHSFVEVYLDGVWHQIDSYIVDEPLARAARHSLSLEGRVVGYGIHINGTSHW
ncbi:MAG: transglutaminase-like domain-containing protein, partial [Verrucomicrobiota bacterium]